MTKYYKHTVLLLMLVFSGSFLTEPALAAYNLFELSGEQPASYCIAGFMNTPEAGDDESREALNTEEETDKPAINNCSNTLQLMSPGVVSVISPHLETAHYSLILLPSSKLFVYGIADPPRLV